MPELQPRYSMEEFARRGQEIYETQVRALVETEHVGEFVAVDIETGKFAVDKDDYTAAERLLAEQPGAQIWLLRVGHPAAYRLGGPRAAIRRPAA